MFLDCVATEIMDPYTLETWLRRELGNKEFYDFLEQDYSCLKVANNSLSLERICDTISLFVMKKGGKKKI